MVNHGTVILRVVGPPVRFGILCIPHRWSTHLSVATNIRAILHCSRAQKHSLIAEPRVCTEVRLNAHQMTPQLITLSIHSSHHQAGLFISTTTRENSNTPISSLKTEEILR